MALHLVVACSIWTICLFRNRIQYRMRVAGVIGILFLVSVGGFSNFALSGAGHPFLLMSVVFTIIFLDLKHAVLVLIAGCVVIASLGFLYTTGGIDLKIDFNNYNVQTRSWAVTFFSFVLLGGSAIAVIRRLNNALVKSVKDLEQHNDLLEHTVLVRTQDLQKQIEERKSIETSLRVSKGRLKNIADTQNDLVMRFDAKGYLNYVNRAYCQFTGKSEKSLIGTSLYVEVPQADTFILKAHFLSFRTDRNNLKHENTLKRRDGVVRIFEWWNFAQFDDDGTLVEIQSVGRDITAQVRTREALEKAQIDSQKANTAKSEFLSTMSHEIRTPLNGVLGIAQLLKDTDLNEDQKGKVNTILSSGQILLAIINDVLDMSKIEAGALELEERAFSLGELLLTITTPFQSLADDKGLKLIVNSDVPSGYIIKGDPVRLRQILWNLLSNAIKFTEEGNVTVKVEIDAQTNEIDEMGPELKDQLIYFSIEDSGAGISSDRIDSIFEAFTQEDNTITRKHGGTGLGLSIVRQLVDLMGGTINAKSQLGEGSTFYVYLPFSNPTTKEIESVSMRHKDTSIQEAQPLKIILAEDNEVNTIIAKSFLEKFGHEVRHVENGKLAVDAAAEGWADLILMDIHMPEMNGIDATKAIRLTELGKNLPIIGLTAEAFTERHVLFREAGMNDVLTKPFTEQQLADTLIANRLLESD